MNRRPSFLDTEQFLEEMERIGDLPAGDERALRVLGAAVPLLNKLFPEFAKRGYFDDLFALFADRFDKLTTDVHGGHDAGLTREVWMLHLAAFATVLSIRTEISKRRARCTVSEWVGGDPVASTIENWMSGGKSLKVADRPDRSDALKKFVELLNGELDRYRAAPEEIAALLKLRAQVLQRRLRQE